MENSGTFSITYLQDYNASQLKLKTLPFLHRDHATNKLSFKKQLFMLTGGGAAGRHAIKSTREQSDSRYSS